MNVTDLIRTLADLRDRGMTMQTVALDKEEVMQIVEGFAPGKKDVAWAILAVPSEGQTAPGGHKALRSFEASRAAESPPRALRARPDEGTVVALMVAPTELEVD